MRRFCWRPSGVSLGATGSVSPLPTTSNLPGSIPLSVMYATTERARSSESRWLASVLPTSSV